MPTAAISVENLGKAYRLGVKEETPDTLAGALQGMLHAPFKNWKQLARLNTFRHNVEAEDLFWALKDVSFEVPEGEVLGVIGRNGAGKSTLLKILSRITEPTRGRAVIRGRVSSLLEVGTGFHPDLSGRDNIYMNGTILGMSKREIDRKFDEIVEFSGVETFLDTPIKRYSSGMKVRLAFSVAAHLEPEILIIDEVLAVGDAEFQRKCLGKMQDVARLGRTVLFVSHNMAAVKSLCVRVIALRNGSIVSDGSANEVVSRYLDSCDLRTDLTDSEHPERSGSGAIKATKFLVCDEYDNTPETLIAGRPVKFIIDYISAISCDEMNVVLTIYNSDGFAVTNCSTRVSGAPIEVKVGVGRICCELADTPLPPSQYRVAMALQSDGATFDHVPSIARFTIAQSMFFPNFKTPPRSYCAVMVRHSWAHAPADAGMAV